MHAGLMVKRLARLLSPSTWKALSRSAPALLGALKQYSHGQDEAALRSFEECLRWMPRVPADYLAFHANLLVLNRRSPDAAHVFKQVLTSTSDDCGLRSRYAAAYARYYLALIERTDEALALNRWQEARDLQPAKGFASKYLRLPDPPVLS
jgi:tetratricopeptide (TPR) repeat protein